MDKYDDTRNKEGYKDTTPYKAITHDERKKKAYYAFQTMISVARLAGFYVNQSIVIEDSHGNKYNSDVIMNKKKKKPDV